jgi:3-deoxy-manno-octulosonate cytidylyltransferase (CMP-KDO synthetase)
MEMVMTTNTTAILIPARYASTRFPGKPLTLLQGIPMVRLVYERCRKAAQEIGADVIVLTDDERIAERFNPNEVWLDDGDYLNGTERCAAFSQTKRGEQYRKFINVQGDMPDITTDIIKYVYYNLNQYDITTAHTDMDPKLRENPHTVKLIEGNGKVLWCGRGLTKYGKHHLGVYGYWGHKLTGYRTLPVTAEEDIEQLEQLRWLKNGCTIGTQSVYFNGIEINSPEDVDAWHQNKLSQ